MELFCTNPECRWHSEHKGGRFLYMKARAGRPAGPYCEDCVRNWYEGAPGKNLWDFTTANISGDPIHVTSFGHLQQLEKQYGVRSVVGNMDERHWSRTAS